jgi:hypothetical protein
MAGFLRKISERAVPLLLLGVLAVPASALAAEAGRFVLKEADQNTFIRLDTLTGAVSHCASRAGEWSCKALNDDRKELHDEIAALKKENAELKAEASEVEMLRKENSRLKTRLDDGQGKGESRLILPSDEDIDRVMALFEKYFERFLSFIRQLDEKHRGSAI